MHATGWHSGYFAIGWLEQRRARRHTYQLQWEILAANDLEKTSRCTNRFLLGMQGRVVSSARNMIVKSQVAASHATVHVLPLPNGVLPLPALVAALSLVQSLTSQIGVVNVVMITQGTQGFDAAHARSYSHAGAWGLNRTAKSEAPRISLCCTDVCSPNFDQIHCGESWITGIEPDILVDRAFIRAPRLMTARMVAEAIQDPKKYSDRKLHLIPGGTGGIGLLTGVWLAYTSRSAFVVLVSRSGTLSNMSMETLKASGAAGACHMRSGNIAESSDVMH